MSLELRPSLTPRLLRRVRAAAKRAICDAVDSGATSIAIRQTPSVASESARLEVTADGQRSVVTVGGEP